MRPYFLNAPHSDQDFTILGFLQISCCLETILKECEIPEDLKKILET